MKYAVIIMDGAADIPLAELDGVTPLGRAATPNLDRVAMMGRLGRVRTTPTGMEAGSALCSLCLLGYDPRTFTVGQGAVLPSFHDLRGVGGAMVSAADPVLRIAAAIGWDVPGRAACSTDEGTDLAAIGKATSAAIKAHDIVCCHVSSPDDASCRGDWEGKVAAIEAIDSRIVGPVLDTLTGFGDPETDPKATGWRLLIAPSHYSLVGTGETDPTPVPFAMAGAWVRSMVKRPFSEANAAEADLQIEQGHELMEYFLRGGLATVRGGAGFIAEVKRTAKGPKKAPGQLRRHA